MPPGKYGSGRVAVKFRELKIKGLFAVELELREDNRGAFARTYCKNEFSSIGHNKEFVQFNHSWNKTKGTLRGLHYQKPPFKEIKLIRCIRGAVFDVLVDIRQGSPTFLQHVSIELSEANKTMILVPEGVAHGFQTLADHTELLYHHTEYYKPGFEAGMLYNDKKLQISWPLPVTEISDRDLAHPIIDDNFKGID